MPGRPVAPRVRRAPLAAPVRPAPPAPPRRRGLTSRLFGWAAILVAWGLVAGFVALVVMAWDLPRPEDALAATRRPSVTLLAADGALLATSGDLYGETVRLQGGRLSVERECAGRRETLEFGGAPRVRIRTLAHEQDLIELQAPGRRLSVGRHVRPQWRCALAGEMRRALQAGDLHGQGI